MGGLQELTQRKKMKIAIAVLVVLVFTFALAFPQQQQPDELQRVKDALVISTIQVQDLAKKNQELSFTIQRIADDLRSVKTIEQLDSLKQIYGIPVEPDSKKKK
jgi:thiamine biosynthesis lipoprotein ApbE